MPTRIPVTQVTALDISVGQTTNTRAVKKRNHFAEIIGAVAGAAVGIAAGAGSNTIKVLLGTAGAIGGYFAGREYGVITSPNHDEWMPVMLPARGS